MSSSHRRLSPAKEIETPSEHVAKVIQNMPFEVIKYEKKQIRDTLSKTHLDSKLKKHLLEAKYRNLQNRINFVQLSIIFLASVSTFMQAIGTEIGITGIFSEIIYIFISSYTALVLSISRFLKWETQKEEISKLIVNYAHIINKIKHQLRRIENVDIELREKLWGDLLKDLQKDKIEEDITKYNTVLDTILSSNEKVYYQNRLQHLKVKGFINSKYDSMIDIISRKENRNNIQISSYKRPGSWFCCNVKYDTSRFLKDMEVIVDRFEKEQQRNQTRNNIKAHNNLNRKYRIQYNNDNIYSVQPSVHNIHSPIEQQQQYLQRPIQSINIVGQSRLSPPIQRVTSDSTNRTQTERVINFKPPDISRSGHFIFPPERLDFHDNSSNNINNIPDRNNLMSKVSFMPVNNDTVSIIESLAERTNASDASSLSGSESLDDSVSSIVAQAERTKNVKDDVNTSNNLPEIIPNINIDIHTNSNINAEINDINIDISSTKYDESNNASNGNIEFNVKLEDSSENKNDE
jgi:hypothetical protein